ncbi:MAG: 1-deoxy-D-xylulose-5-phosphate reductoisomerase [Planctomycetes bacterium]|nr:1-deoxy-D-xylulose-5-phosphate reductoisomerase [Planctomycetota bacterium]
MKKIALLGATGSIGTSTLDVVRKYPDRFTLVAVSAGNNSDLMSKIIEEFKPRFAGLADSGQAEALRARHSSACTIFGGNDASRNVIRECDADICVSAIVGHAGLLPTIDAIEKGMDIALANKETLVAAGKLVIDRLKSGQRILPVDSEHSAIFQCLECGKRDSVNSIILTASGGPFRGKSRAELESVTVKDALQHPTWSMGSKITVDSATLANKALEVIEAHWLFDMPFEKIGVLVHPQSIVHGMVEFCDGSLISHMSRPDMRAPIQYALSYPERLDGHKPCPTPEMLSGLCFEEPDNGAFPMLELGITAGKAGGLMPAAFSSANEEAVKLFLEERLPFNRIDTLVNAAMADISNNSDPVIEDILEAEQTARESIHRRFSE